MKLKESCTEKTRRGKIVLEENKSKLILNNTDRREVLKVKVDDCQIKDGIRCDYFLAKGAIEYYVELKNTDVSHALRQIEQTISVLSSDAARYPKITFVICSRVPKTSAEIQVSQLRFKKKYNAALKIKSSPFEDKI